MDIPPTKADLAQVQMARDGKYVEIEDDVQGIANSLSEIDPHLRLRFSEAGGHYVVFFKDEQQEYIVTTATELDGRLVPLIRKLHWQATQPGYSFADELDKVEKQAEKDRDAAYENEHGEAFSRLAHAMRKDTGRDKNRVFVK